MRISNWLGRGTALMAIGVALSAVMIGCGGGGGGNNNSGVPTGRSYTFSSATQALTMSVDAEGRFTVFAKDSTGLPNGTGAQGTISSNGQFFAQSDDGVTQFTGTVAGDGNSVSGNVQRNGANVIVFNAQIVTSGTTTPAESVGSYNGTTGTTAASLTIDATSHATLYANINGTIGGGLLNLSGTGALQSADNSIVAQFTNTGSAYTLLITKLNGVAVNATVNLTRVTRAKWTFMVFLNGANNLEQFGPLNVNQMEKVGSTAQVNMVVQWKRANCFDCGNPEWAATRRYFIKQDNNTSQINSQLVQDMGPSVDMGDWHELRNFIAWSQQHYPADHYALVIWNHGAGWRPTRGQTNRLPQFPRSVSIDDSTNHEIQIWELPQALAVTPKMDMVIFDASLMQMTEVAYEIRNSTPLMVGSEESPPGEGYVYDTFLADLVGNPDMTAAQFGTQIVNRTMQAYGNNNNLTQSEIDLSKMQGVADALNAFGTKLQQHLGDTGASTLFTNARSQAQSYAYPENKDLWDYADLIKNGTSAGDLQTAATNIQNAIAASRIAEGHGTINGKSHGLAIYVPNPTAYLSSYGNLALARATSWPVWLQNQPH